METPENSSGSGSSQTNAPERKRPYPRQFSKEVEDLIAPKELTLQFTPKTSKVSSNIVENNDDFWTTSGTIPVGNSNILLVKRYRDGLSDNVYMLRLNNMGGANGSKLKFPSFWISTFVKRMGETINRFERDADGRMMLPEIQDVTPRDELAEDSFWDSGALRIAKIRIKPFLSEFGTLTFRLWMEVDPKFHREYQNEKGVTAWKGPQCNISVDCYVGLKEALQTLLACPPETSA